MIEWKETKPKTLQKIELNVCKKESRRRDSSEITGPIHQEDIQAGHSQSLH